MGQHFLLHRDLVAATAVHHAVHAHLTSDAQADLVVASPQFLRVYRIEPLPETAESNAPASGHVLRTLASFPLAGVVESMHVLQFDRRLWRKTAQSSDKKGHTKQKKRSKQSAALQRFDGGQEVLLLSFTWYKWVLVGYDRTSRSLVTLAMYSFAEEAIGPGATLKGEKNGREQMLGLATHGDVRVDPQTRCAAMLLYGDQLVVVPFRSGSVDLSFFEEDEEDDDVDMDGDAAQDGSDQDDDADDDEDDDDEEEKRLEELVNESKQRGGSSNEVNSQLRTLLDKSVKVGAKRKRNHASGLLANELTGREFLLRLSEMEITGKVVDLAFLDGYLEPTLMLLHEENGKHATDGRFAAGFDTFCLTVISINMNTRLHPKIWTVKNLPSDCFRLIPCRAPVGGVVVVSANAILYFNQTQFHGLATNVFAERTVNQALFPLQEAQFINEANQPEPLHALLYDCQYEYLNPKELLLAVPNGDLFVLSLPFEDTSKRGQYAFGGGSGGPRALSLSLRKVQSGPSASCLSVHEGKKTLFIGSRSGDSVLYAVKEEPLEDDSEEHLKQEDDEMTGIKAEPEAPEAKEEAVEEEEDEDDLFLYGSAPVKEEPVAVVPDGDKAASGATNGSASTNGANSAIGARSTRDANRQYRYELAPVDVMPSVGPITSIDLGVKTNTDSNEKREELVISGGALHHGAISVLHNGLRPIVSTEAELNGCRAMWTVSSSLPTTMKSGDGRTFDSYLILSISQRTMVLRTGEGMEPLEEDCGFYTTGPTLAAANLFDKKRIVQIFKQGARVMTEVEVEPTDEPVKEKEEEEKVNGEGNEDDEEGEDDESNVKLVCTQEITLEGDVESGGMNVDAATVGIVSADVIDPFILLLLTDGTIRLLMGDEEDLELTVIDPEISNYDGEESTENATKSTISSACLFYDWAGMFKDLPLEPEAVVTPRSKAKRSAVDEDDDMDGLYATSASPRVASAPASNGKESIGEHESVSIPLLPQKEAAMMCALCFEDGSLHVFSLPDFTRKAIFPYLTFAPQWLVNTMPQGDNKKAAVVAPVLGLNASSASANDGRIKKSHTINSPVADIAIHRIGPSEGLYNAQYFARMVLLVFLANGDLLTYAAMPINQQGKATRFQFARVGTDLITRPFLPPKAKAGSSHNETGNNPEANTSAMLAKLRAGFRYPMLTRFSNVNNMSGVFFRGAHPMWILCERGHPSFIPMCVTGSSGPALQGQAQSTRLSVPVLSFTPFHHWNCPNGFIYFHSRGVLRVCELPSSKTSTILPSSGGFVLQKAEFGATIHHMMYLGDHGPGGVSEALQIPTYAVVCSTKMTPKEAAKATENEDELEELEPEDDANANGNANIMAPTAEMFPDLNEDDLVETEEDVYELRLVQTNEFGDWNRQGVFRVHFERYEVVLSVKVMYLYDSSLMKEDVSSTSPEWAKKKRPYVVVGTGFVGPHGEDESGRGRLLLYELDYAQYVNQGGSTSGKLPKLKLIFIKDHRQGAISQVAQLGPYVLAAVGSKLIVYEFKSEQLIGCAFYDAQMFIVSLNVVRDFVMYADVYKSVQFLRWREKQRQLVLLAKDYEPLAVTSTEFNLYDKRLALLAVDMETNLHVMQFAPQDIEARGGQRLLRTGDFHLGVNISSMFRKRVPADKTTLYVNVLGSSEGGVGVLVPVGERVFRRLFTLQNVMINTLPQNCALNPREFRTLKANAHRRSGRPDAWSKQKWKKSFLDAHVLLQFPRLDYVAQKELARCIGTTPEVVLHNLLEVQRSTATFL